MSKPKLLPERIAEFRAELDAFIDAKAAEVKKNCPGVPVEVIRQMMTNRSPGCQCQAVQIILQSEQEKAA